MWGRYAHDSIQMESNKRVARPLALEPGLALVPLGILGPTSFPSGRLRLLLSKLA